MKCCLQISSKNYNDQVKDKGFDSLAVTHAWGGCHGLVLREDKRTTWPTSANQRPTKGGVIYGVIWSTNQKNNTSSATLCRKGMWGMWPQQRNVKVKTKSCDRQNNVNYINARAPSLKLSSVVTTFGVRSKGTHANWSLYVAVVYHRGTYIAVIRRGISSYILSWSLLWLCLSPSDSILKFYDLCESRFLKGLILARRGLTPESAPPC